jgi:transcriptional regulator with XRE-family HTH domain
MADVDPVLKAFGSNVHRLRLNLKLTQEGLAEIAKLHPTYVSGIERGIRNPTILSSLNIASALNCKIADLFKRPNSLHDKKRQRKK